MKMKNVAKEIFTKTNSTNSSDLVNEIRKSNCEIVSFDIFDTLIKRNVYEPKDVFLILQNKFNEHFKTNLPIAKLRQKAEKIANIQTNKNDVNLDNIYKTLACINGDQRQWLKNEEISLEKIICQVNHKMLKVYNWCKNNGKKIIIISDMYLPKSVIKNILLSSGYSGWDELYVSNEYGVRKSTGELFDIVLKLRKINRKKLIHIGDAQKGDYLIPKRMGIKALLIKTCENETPFFNRKYLACERNEAHYSYNIINSFVKNNIRGTCNYFEKIGYEVIGPILYGYSLWLQNKIRKDKINHLFFLTREGAFLKKAFDIVKDEKTDTTLIRVSRRATSLPLLYKATSFEELFNSITVSRSGFTLGEFLRSLGLSNSKISNILTKLDISKDTIVERLTKKDKKKIFEVAKPLVDKLSRQQEINIKGYLKELNFRGRVGVCDVGWHGTIQHHLEQIFSDVNIKGFYIGKKDKKGENSVPSVAYLFSNTRNLDLRDEIMSSPDLFESFFLSTDGSALYYDKNHIGKYYCVQAEPEQTAKSAHNIIKLQEAALQFILDFKQLREQLNVNINDYSAAAAYTMLIGSPSMKTINEISSFSFLNVKSHSMIATHSLPFYLLHLGILRTEFLNSGSKSLFLKSLIKLPLPYVKIIKFLRNFDKN